MKFNKSIIAPLVAVVSYIVATIFHVELPKDVQGQITDIIVQVAFIGSLVYGIFKNHKKEVK